MVRRQATWQQRVRNNRKTNRWTRSDGVPCGTAIVTVYGEATSPDHLQVRRPVKARLAQALIDGKPHGQPKGGARLAPGIPRLRKQGLSKRAIAKRLFVSCTSVIRRPQKRV